jgi:hypothetical protein
MTTIDPRKKISVLETTLYELIEAVGQEVLPGEEQLVNVIVEHILETGRSVEKSR